MWWNSEVKAALERKETAWKVLGTRDVVAKERCMEAYKKKRERLNGLYIRAKRR